MMKTKFKRVALIWVFALTPFALSGVEIQDWPEGVESKIEEIFKIKKGAMIHPGMRSREDQTE